jgi:tetratricopeptide (TPR) repeat protein
MDRKRTESMAQRMAKQPLSDAFDLWDRGYILGAMRLFMFKAENSPPFQVGVCLDGVAHLLARLDEVADAKENFGFAAEKYELIQQPILSKMMLAKGVEVTEGVEAALAQVDDIVRTVDGDGQSAAADAKRKAPFARLYGYRAELNLLAGKIEAGLADAQKSIDLHFDRVYTSYFTLGALHEAAGNDEGAVNAFRQCLAKCPHYVAAFEPLAAHLKKMGKLDEAVEVLARAIEVHPRAAFIRAKAYALSDKGLEAEALAFLDAFIAHPPHEETESLLAVGDATVAALLTAKTAILADGGKLEAAKACAMQALKLCPGDEDAAAMLADIEEDLKKK